MIIKQLITNLLDFRLYDKIKSIRFEIDENGEEHFQMEVFGGQKKKKYKEDDEESFT